MSSAAGSTGVAPGSTVTAATDTAEVVVSAEQPGPGLWKVSKGDHVLWVLGTVSTLPKHMKWKTQEVEKALASSQAILSAPGATPDANIGFFSAVMLVPALLGIEKLPDGATLEQVLPPPLYARWTVQRQRYLGEIEAAEKALSEYQQSFAMLRMSDVLLPSGVLPMLKAKGYSVLEPGAPR